MRALLFKNGLKLVNDYPKPEPGKGEALVRVKLAGICKTDLEITNGYMGFTGILGHEFCGVIDAVGDSDLASGKGSGESLKPGTRVVGEINCGCGGCSNCLKGLKAHCQRRSTLGISGKDGCLAEYVTLPLDNLYQVPENVSDREAVFVEPLAAAFEITEQIQLKPSAKVAVLGDGRLGILSALVLNLTCADLTLIGKHPEKLEIASGQNVKTVLLQNLEKIQEYDLVVDATGNFNGYRLALDLLKPRGCLVLKSTITGNEKLNLTPLVLREITLVGSRCGPFEPALRALGKRIIGVSPLISAIFKLEQAVEAFAYCKGKSPLKVLIDLN